MCYINFWVTIPYPCSDPIKYYYKFIFNYFKISNKIIISGSIDYIIAFQFLNYKLFSGAMQHMGRLISIHKEYLKPHIMSAGSISGVESASAQAKWRPHEFWKGCSKDPVDTISLLHVIFTLCIYYLQMHHRNGFMHDM